MPSADLAAPTLVIFGAVCRVFPISGLGFAAIYPVVVVIRAAFRQRLEVGHRWWHCAFFFPFSISALAKGIGIEQALWFYPAIGLAMALAAVLCPHTRDIGLGRYYIAGDLAIFAGEGERPYHCPALPRARLGRHQK
jgi:hypothetical protein